MRYTQPQSGARIDWSNPITRGLTVARNQANEVGPGLSAAYSSVGKITRAASTSSGGKVLPATGVATSGTILLVGYAPSTNSNEYIFDGETATARDLFSRIGSTGNFIWYSGGVEVADASPIPSSLWAPNTFAAIALKWTPSAQTAYKNGVSFVSKSASLTTASNRAIRLFGRYSSTEGAVTGGLALFLQWDRALSDAEIKSLSDNPWQIFVGSANPIFVGLGASVPTDPAGDLAATESGADTAALSGQIVVQGAFAVTESGADTAAIQGGASPVTGTLSATETGTDTSAISGGVVVAGALATTESGIDTASIASQLVVQGVLAASESGSDTALINGSSVIITTGTLAATESGADGCVTTGSVLVQGLLDAAESGTDTVYAPGQIYVIGALVATETGSDTCAIAGSSPATITGTLDAVEVGSDTCQIFQSIITAVYPAPDQVLNGITYGPTGADYTGTATAGSFPTATDIAAAVRADLSAELARIDAAISSRATVAAIMGATAP